MNHKKTIKTKPFERGLDNVLDCAEWITQEARKTGRIVRRSYNDVVMEGRPDRTTAEVVWNFSVAANKKRDSDLIAEKNMDLRDWRDFGRAVAALLISVGESDVPREPRPVDLKGLTDKLRERLILTL